MSSFLFCRRIKAQQGRGTVEAAFGATANVFNCKGEPLLSLLVESKSMDELEEPLSQLRSNISARGGYVSLFGKSTELQNCSRRVKFRVLAEAF